MSERQPQIVNSADRPWLELALRWLLAAVLVWAALSKLVDPISFYGSMLEYQLPLSHGFLKLVAVILPWLELFCGLLLVARIAPRATLTWITALFLLFLVLVSQALFRGLDINCGCFDLSPLGISDGSSLGHFLESVGFAVIRNLVFLVITGFLWRLAPSPQTAAAAATR